MNTAQGQGIVVKDLTHSYGSHQVLDDLSFEVNSGDIHCLLGNSGSGKSTLLRTIAGLENPSNGSISIDGRVVFDATKNIPAEQRSVGIVFQDYALFPHLNIYRNIAFGIGNKPLREKQDIVRDLLDLVELAGCEQKMPHELSGGEQQRVALARAIACEPNVLLLDEPFSNLDRRLRSELRALTCEVLRSKQITAVLVTHHPEEALACGDRISIISDGRIHQTTEADSIYYHPIDLPAAEIFGVINQLTSKRHEGHITTSLGTLKHDHFSELENGKVLVRPELIKVNTSTNESDTQGVIKSITAEGGSYLIVVSIENEEDVFARVPTPYQLKTGDKVQISLW